MVGAEKSAPTPASVRARSFLLDMAHGAWQTRPVETLGARVQRLRHAKGWTARELGQRAGMGDSAISRIETGKIVEPRLATFLRLADALGVSVAELRGAEGQERRQIVMQPLRAARYSCGGTAEKLRKTHPSFLTQRCTISK